MLSYEALAGEEQILGSNERGQEKAKVRTNLSTSAPHLQESTRRLDEE
jgi:hypothetical protein